MTLPHTKNAVHLYVYQYHFLDDLSFVKDPREADVFAEKDNESLTEMLAAVRECFLCAGWEGDGEIGVIWLPPFVDVGIEDTWGNYIWHVKQSNNGTSWLASRAPLDFRRLRAHNESSLWRTHRPVSLVYSECRTLVRRSEAIVAALERKLAALSPIEGPLASEIREDLLFNAQGTLVRELQEFLDDCYLQVLIEVFENGNPSKLKIGKFKARLNPARYLPPDEEGPALVEDSEDGSAWFTMKGLIHDIWWSYKFEPFKEKLALLFRAVEFNADEVVKRELTKHVLLRNCIQHHQGQLTADALQEAGAKDFHLLQAGGQSLAIAPWKHIQFGAEELSALLAHLRSLAESFTKHVSKRIRSIVWIPIEEHAGGD